MIVAKISCCIGDLDISKGRVLLDKQDKLRCLEKQLDEFDRANEDCAVSNQPNEETRDDINTRNELLDQVLSSYSRCSTVSCRKWLVNFSNLSLDSATPYGI